MKRLHIYRHVDCEGPGFLQTVLEQHSIPYKIIAIDAGEAVDFDLSSASALVFMGGNMSVNDDLPWIHDELELIRRARAQGIPMLGHCLGGQLLSKALGATVGANPTAEIGWYPVFQTATNQHALLAQLPPSFLGFHWHRETFNIPEDGELLFSSDLCPRQGYILDNVLALQTHIEMTQDLVRSWVERFPQDLTGTAPGEQTAQQVLSDLEKRITELNQTANFIYRFWLRNFVL